VPLVSPRLLEGLCDRIGSLTGQQPPRPDGPGPVWAVPEVGGHLQVTVSAMRLRLLPSIMAHLETGRRDPRSLVGRLRAEQPGSVVVVPEVEVLDLDPDLMSFRDLDTPRDLEELGRLLASRGER
jgi:hypothetical protein